jgi:hypothetical protein
MILIGQKEMENKQKKKILSNFSVLPDDTLQEIFTFLPGHEIFVNISKVSKEFNKLLSSKDFLVQLLKANGLFSPVLKNETSKNFYASFSSFYRNIFYPMETTKTFTLKLKQIYSNFFKPNEQTLESITLQFNELLKDEIEFPPSFQIFSLFCNKWGGTEDHHLIIKGAEIFNYLKQHKIPKDFLNFASVHCLSAVDGYEDYGMTNLNFCLNNSEFFDRVRIVCPPFDLQDEELILISKKHFHQLIKEIYEFIEEMISYNTHFFEDIGCSFYNWQEFVDIYVVH